MAPRRNPGAHVGGAWDHPGLQRRHILLEGSLNLRDLGGYESADGRLVRAGCVFRSDELHALTDADVAVISSLGIRVLFDLRNAHERIARPNRLPTGVEVLERTSPSTTGVTRTTDELIALGLLAERDDEEFAMVYVGLLDRLAPELRTIVERAVDAPTRPLLFHCAAGKDRTGIAAAVLLGLLGVPDEVTLDDYELTSVYSAPRRIEALADAMAEHGVTDERVRPLLEARRPVLAAALRYIRERWGGFDGYATEHLAVDNDLPQRLRNALLIDETNDATRSS
jgi:protein-tyrosine phosphatase